MNSKVLDALKSEQFEVEIGQFMPAAALRKKLVSLAEVRQLVAMLGAGSLSDQSIRQFVSNLMRDYRPGQRFDYDAALAAIAVALERRASDFAEEYLCDLARLSNADMPISIRVARECLRYRAASVTRDQVKTNTYQSGAATHQHAEFQPTPTLYGSHAQKRPRSPDHHWPKGNGVKAC